MPLIPAPGSTILCEGDSLTAFRVAPCLDTWAWQRMTGAAYGYPERVGDWIFCNRPDLRLSLRNGAVGGSCMRDVLGRWAAVEVLKPAIVVMTVGTNDCNHGVFESDMRDQMADYCRRLDLLCGGRVIYLARCRPILGGAPCPVERERAAAGHAAAASDAVRDANGLVVDLDCVLQRRARDLAALWEGHTIFHDGLHFNAVGNEIVAAVVLQALGLMIMTGSQVEPGG